MEVINTLDIDGTQWGIMDNEARNEIVTLKKEIEKLKTVEKWEYSIPDYGGDIVARRQGNIVNITGINIGRIKEIPNTVGDINLALLPERFRPSISNFFMMRTSGTYVTQYGGVINPDGLINFYTYTNVNYGYFSVSYIVD